MVQESADDEPVDPQLLAAQLVAENRLTGEQIAERVGVHRNTLSRWKKDPEFAAKVDEIQAEMFEAAKRFGIGTVANRLREIDRRYRRLLRVIDERSKDPSLQVAAGGDTGLLVRQIKGIGSGDNFQRVEEFAVDTGLLAELRALEEAAAKQLGQFVTKTDLTTSGQPMCQTILYLPHNGRDGVTSDAEADQSGSEQGPAETLPGRGQRAPGAERGELPLP